MTKQTATLIAENVRKLRGKKSKAQASRDTGIQYSYWLSIEKAEANITAEMLDRLATYFGVPVVRLLGYEEKPRPIIEQKVVISDKPLYGENIENFVPVPLLADPASLGPGLEINETNVQGTCLIHRQALRNASEPYCIVVTGDSMAPILEDGNIVAVDVKKRDPRKLIKKLVACHIGDFAVTVKQLLLVNGKFYFRAWNKKWEEEHAPLITAQKDGLILGKVIWAWKEFK